MSAMPLAKLLIVDDEAAQMEALCETLQLESYSTAGFTSASDALTALRPGEFELLLTDLTMPEMDGISLLRAALAVDGNLVGIVMTGLGTVATAVEAIRAGAIDYILKPFRLSVILPALTRALEVRRLRMENAELEQGLRQRTKDLDHASAELKRTNRLKSEFLALTSRGFKFEPVNCRDVVVGLAASLRLLAESKGVAFDLTLPETDVILNTDRRALTQLLNSLVQIGIKHTDRGIVRLELQQRLSNGQVRTAFSVVHMGMGLRANDQVIPFQAFQAVQAGRRGRSTGPGLHLGYELAELLGGHIEFEGILGRSSRFSLVFSRR